MSQRPTVKRDFSFGNPTVRAWLYQLIAIVAVLGVVGYLVHNTITPFFKGYRPQFYFRTTDVTGSVELPEGVEMVIPGDNIKINLANRGITSGFGFLERTAGFGIVQHLIEYTERDTYAPVFMTGLTNTLLVSALCIIFASILGFAIGLARLSDNWLLRKLSNIYIETFRNILPLLQIFFWYSAVLRNLPGPRQALNAFDLAYVSNRGLYVPWPTYALGSWPFVIALLLAIAASYGLYRFNRKHQLKTGQLRCSWPAAIAMLILFPLIAHLGFGAATHWDVPQLRGFNFRGGSVIIPELAALTLALSIYTSSFIAEVICSGIQSVPYGQHEAARSLGLPHPVKRCQVIIPPLTSQYLNIVKNSSLAAAIGYPDMVSLFASSVLNQTGQAIETIAHGRLSDYQPADFTANEPLQPQNCAG